MHGRIPILYLFQLTYGVWGMVVIRKFGREGRIWIQIRNVDQALGSYLEIPCHSLSQPEGLENKPAF